MNDLGWIDAVLASARPQVMGALLRYFRDLDTAEEAFQEACLRALKTWPQNGPPRDAAAWLILVGRNAAMDDVRRRAKQVALPDEAAISDLDDAESELAERLDGAHYRDDILRLLFICCHPELPATQQIALALRIVCGLSVKQIARAFLVSEAAMEQRITRAKARIADAGVPFEAPGAPERAERLAAVAAMIYLVFNEGYSAPSERGHDARGPGRGRDLAGAACCCACSRANPEVMGLAALMLLQQARAAARFDGDGDIVLLEDQDRSRWNPKRIAEGLALIDKAMRHRRPGPYQVQAAIAALHARAERAEDTDWAQIDLLYANLERLQPSPVVTLNRAVAVNKMRGPAAALAMIEPLDERLAGYFYFHGVKGALLQQLDRRAEAREAFDRAISLAHTPAEAAHIRQHLDHLDKDERLGWRKKLDGPLSDLDLAPFVLGAESTTETDMTAANPPVLGGVAPYLGVSNAGKAADFYAKAFGATEVMRMPPDEKGRYMHIHLVINGGSVMLADAFPDHGHPLETPGAFMLHLQVDDVDAWWKRAVEAGAEVLMPVSEMFWGDRYGQLRDPFGIKWSIATPIKKS